MFAAVRRYAGLEGTVVRGLVENSAAIRAALTSGPGSRGCHVIGTRDGLIVVTVGDDESSVIEAGRRFVAWIDRHVPEVRAITPEVWAGDVLVDGVDDAVDAEGGTR
jgi:hypothetical protein